LAPPAGLTRFTALTLPADLTPAVGFAGAAAFAVKHLVQVMETVQARMQQKATAEQVVREEEARLLDLAKALGQPDLRGFDSPGNSGSDGRMPLFNPLL